MAKSKKDFYLNKRFTTNQGYEIIVSNYFSNSCVEVKFENGSIVRTNVSSIEKGTVINPFHPSVCGKGYLGVGKHIASINRKQTKKYIAWHSMLVRCYDEKYQERQETYKECSVCEEWLNFQNFGDWFDENYYEVKGETMCLDKDILVNGNKQYSPTTCVFVPSRINLLFTKRDKKRGEYSIGVFLNNRYKDKKYVAVCGNLDGVQERIGRYETEEEAFLAYKKFKEKTFKEVAEMYKDKIPTKLYVALKESEVVC